MITKNLDGAVYFLWCDLKKKTKYFEEVTFELKLYGGQETSHQKSIPDRRRGNTSGKNR